MRSVPNAYKLVAVAVFAIYFTLPLIALSRASREGDQRGADDAAGAAARAGGIRERPDPRGRGQPRARGRAAPFAAAVRRRARGDDPRHRHERRDHRRLAYHVLDVDVPADAGDLPATPPAAQDAVHRARAVRRDRADRGPAARRRQLRRHALLARRDALVHGRPRGDGAPADATRPADHLPRPSEPPPPGRRLAALRDPRRDRDRPLVPRDPRAEPADALGRPRLDRRRLCRVRDLSPVLGAGVAHGDAQGAARLRRRARARVPTDRRADRPGAPAPTTPSTSRAGSRRSAARGSSRSR